MAVQYASNTLGEVVERVLDKGIIIDAWVRVSLAGIAVMTVDARVVVASLETYCRYAGQSHDHEMRIVTAVRRGSHARRGAGDAGALRIVREAFDAWNGHDPNRYAALLDDGYVGVTHQLPPPLWGREAAREDMDRYFRVLPDLHFTIESALATGDDVLVSWRATATPRNGGTGVPLTTRPLEVAGCTVTRLRDGKIVHTWNYWDTTPSSS